MRGAARSRDRQPQHVVTIGVAVRLVSRQAEPQRGKWAGGKQTAERIAPAEPSRGVEGKHADEEQLWCAFSDRASMAPRSPLHGWPGVTKPCEGANLVQEKMWRLQVLRSRCASPQPAARTACVQSRRPARAVLVQAKARGTRKGPWPNARV